MRMVMVSVYSRDRVVTDNKAFVHHREADVFFNRNESLNRLSHTKLESAVALLARIPTGFWLASRLIWVSLHQQMVLS
jgi:hypothetical protein